MPSQSKDLKGKTNFNPGKPMSQKLKLVRQNYCRSATVESKRTPYLFALEKECEQGKALLAKSPKTLLHLQKFNPNGVLQTYRDETTGAELPIFAVFDLEGSHQVAYDITMDSGPATSPPPSLPAHVPIQKTQDFVRTINQS